MDLAPLISPDDLAARNIPIEPTATVEALIEAASSTIRDAAGVPITKATSSIDIQGSLDQWLPIPGGPVQSVAEVKIEGRVVSGWKLITGRLWLSQGWQPTPEPSIVTITYTHGYDKTPANIVDLACSLVGAGMAAVADGYDPHRSLTSERIDDYQRTFTRGAEEVVTPMELPESTKQWLRDQFGSGVAVIGTYS